MAAIQIVEPALLPSASSFFRKDVLFGRTQSVAAPGAILAKPVAGVRCLSFSTNRCIGPKTTYSYRKGKVHATNGNFGAPLPEEYGVTEPTKIDGQTVGPADSSVIERMKEGFVKFKEEKYLKETELFESLKDGQQPKVMVIACADSRVCPAMLCGSNPGEIFVVRNVANLVPPCETEHGKYHGTSAALEFAVNYLKVEHIVVIGHRNCGGIKALMSRKHEELESDFIGSWMSAGIPAREHTLVNMKGKTFADQCKYCEQEAVNVSLANLLTFPWIKDKFEAGTLGLHGWYYDFVEGELTSWEVKRPSLAAVY